MRIGGDDTIETYALGNLPGQTLEDNFWLDTYRDELGINVVYDWIVKGDDEYSQKINITIATGELPDIMSVTATQMVQLAEADLIADISDVYEAYAADFTKETLTQEGDDPFLGIWRGNPRPFNDRDESVFLLPIPIPSTTRPLNDRACLAGLRSTCKCRFQPDISKVLCLK